ncbi:MAG: hypothetical protein QCH99_06740 [Candidatus Bathyarchaeota archaeon]|nr:hypothetical protein [Candidatus Bathyarchaeum tardum]WGM90471.1 MAG: hypothetical protein NUK63_04940 [Candidatus Bathyarchaeum tardum]
MKDLLQGLTECIPTDPTPKNEILNLIDYIKTIEPGKTEQCNHTFLHSFKRPILTQVIEQIPSTNQITIIAPTHSSNSYFIEKTLNLFDKKAMFIIDPSRFSVNVDAKSAYQQFQIKKIETDGHRPLHAKIYIFHTDEGDWTLYGSPNFTEAALTKSAKDGGNVEAACLIPPSANWNWTQLFDKSVGLTEVSWADIHFSEDEEQEKPKEQNILVAKWGYENSIREGIIACPGLQDGTPVRVRLYGLDFMIEAIIKNGKLIFDIPHNWNGATRYEIFDTQGNLLAIGDLNRTGAVIPKLENYKLDDAARRRLWYFARRLHNPLPKWLTQRKGEDESIDFLINPELMRLGHVSWVWHPVSRRIEATNPEDFYSRSKRRFEDVIAKHKQLTLNSDNIGSYLRESLNALDLMIEGTFYASLFSENQKQNLVLLAKDLCEWLNLPCSNRYKPLAVPNIQNWSPHFCNPLSEELIQKWKEYGPLLSLDVGILFNYWIYFELRGIESFDYRGLDAVIVTNKYFQIWEALRHLMGEKIVNASRERVFDSRLDVLTSYPKINNPSNIAELEKCLKFAFDRCAPKLQK